MQLDQLQLSYLLDEDRLLLRLGFSGADENAQNDDGKQEIKVFFTRLQLKQMWPVMMQAMASQVVLDRPEAALASNDIVQMEFQNAVNTMTEDGNFAKEFEETNRQWPMGEAPLLLDTIKFHLNANQPMCMQLLPKGQGSIEIRIPPAIMHGFAKLLLDAEAHAGWGLELELPSSDVPAARAMMLN